MSEVGDKLVAVIEWVRNGIARTLDEDPSGFLLGVESVVIIEALADVETERSRLRWTIVELASHTHDCEELLSPRTMRTVSEVQASLAATESNPA